MGPSSLLDFAWASSEKKPSTGGFSLSRLAAMSVLVTSRHFAVLRIWSLSGHNGLWRADRHAVQHWPTIFRRIPSRLVSASNARDRPAHRCGKRRERLACEQQFLRMRGSLHLARSLRQRVPCGRTSQLRNRGWSNSDFGCGVVGTSKVTRTSREPHWGHLQPSAKLFQRKRAPARPNQRAHVQALASFAAVAAHVRIGSGNGNRQQPELSPKRAPTAEVSRPHMALS